MVLKGITVTPFCDNFAQLQDIVSTINGLWSRTMQIEKLLTGQDLYMLQIAHMAPDVTGRMTLIHKLNFMYIVCLNTK